MTYPQPFHLKVTRNTDGLNGWPQCDWAMAVMHYEQHHDIPTVPDDFQKNGIRQTDFDLVVRFLANWTQHPTLTTFSSGPALVMASALPLIAQALLCLCADMRDIVAEEEEK